MRIALQSQSSKKDNQRQHSLGACNGWIDFLAWRRRFSVSGPHFSLFIYRGGYSSLYWPLRQSKIYHEQYWAPASGRASMLLSILWPQLCPKDDFPWWQTYGNPVDTSDSSKLDATGHFLTLRDAYLIEIMDGPLERSCVSLLCAELSQGFSRACLWEKLVGRWDKKLLTSWDVKKLSLIADNGYTLSATVPLSLKRRQSF